MPAPERVARWALLVAVGAGVALVALADTWPLVAFAALVTLQVAFWTAVAAAVMAWVQRRRRPSA